jgi:hypothetical protein
MGGRKELYDVSHPPVDRQAQPTAREHAPITHITKPDTDCIVIIVAPGPESTEQVQSLTIYSLVYFLM